MTTYRGKLLELKSIENESGKYCLNVKLSFEQNIDMLWEIDEYTAENIKIITKFDDKHKYRLSFNGSCDFSQNQYTSILTRTYRDQSESLCFLCSKEYIDNLTVIKHSQHISELYDPTFTFTNIESANIQEENKEESDEDNIHNKYISRSRQRLITAASIILIILFSSLGCIYFNRISFNEKALAESIQQDTEANGEGLVQAIELDNEANENIPVQIIELNNEIVVEQDESLELDSNHPEIPFLELDDIITYSIPEGYVALTFDDGPSEYSQSIMEVLKDYEVGGTFFFAGYNAKKYPNYVQYIQANGYSIGSHSMSHINMAALSLEEQEKELIESIDLLKEITNEEIVLFRAPYGSYNKKLKGLLVDNQYKMVLWNNDPKDWDTRNPDKIFNNIKNTDVSGSIILLHESQAVIDALPSIIEYLQELELKIVSLK